MKYILLIASLSLMSCASTKSIKVESNSQCTVFVNGKSACPVLPTSPCYIKMRQTDSSFLTLSVQNSKNLFIKNFTFSTSSIKVDTSIFVKF